MQSLKDQHAIVTGGATGIGLAITKSLASAGARVTIASRDIERASLVAANLDGVTAAHLDVTDPQSIVAAFDAAGPVDILVNNAGVAYSAPFDRTTLEQWSDLIAVNLTGTFLCAQAALKSMREHGSGRIINIASTAGLKGYVYTSAYTASKHGVVGLTRSLALEFASTGITVNSVCPGFTDTDIVTEAAANIQSKTGRSQEEALAELVKHNPQGRLISPAEVADAVLWLCQNSSCSITGQAIVVAGGEIM